MDTAKTQILLIALSTFPLALCAAPSTRESEVKTVQAASPFLSDDGSVIRALPGVGQVESVHCTLPKGGVIQASRHKTVSQIWYVLSGTGELWLEPPSHKGQVTPLAAGTAVTVPLGYSFQFRNTGSADLEIFIVNTTPWSGAGELIPVANHWPRPGKK